MKTEAFLAQIYFSSKKSSIPLYPDNVAESQPRHHAKPIDYAADGLGALPDAAYYATDGQTSKSH